MATGTYIGNTSFRTFSVDPFEDSRGVDTLQVVLRGSNDDFQTTFDSWTRGKVATSLGYSNMYLEQKRGSTGNGSNFATIELSFAGFLNTNEANPTRVLADVVLQSVTLVSDENDANGDAQNVQVSYYADQSTVIWIYRGTDAPTTPRYPIIVPSTVPTGIFINPFPASYTGTLQAKNVGVLASFSREKITTGVWSVQEVWINRIEPAD